MTTVVNQLYFSRDEPAGRFIFSALDVNLGEVQAQDRPTTISADVIRINGALPKSAHDITICCRQLICSDGSTINTSGDKAQKNHPPGTPPAFAGSPGADGFSGEAGGTGGDAAGVTIMAHQIIGDLRINAAGGDGGRGQDGQNGFDAGSGPDGKTGRPLEFDQTDTNNIPQEADRICDAPRGPAGGAGGRAGTSGGGGKGGRVALATRVALTPGQLIIANNSGAPGAPANPGRPGAGGPAGRPGKQEVLLCSDVTVGKGNQSKKKCTSYTFLLGKEGRRGPEGNFYPALVGQTPASAKPDLRTLTAEQLAPAFKDLLLDMLCWKCEDDYRVSGGVTDPQFVARLNFLIEMCMADPAPDAGKKAVLARILSLKRKAELGLDFYGYSLEDAPLLSYDTYSDIIGQDLFSQLGLVEDNYRQALDKTQSVEKRRASIQAAIADAERTGGQLARACDTSIAIAQDLNKNIVRLEAAITQSRLVLEGARRALEDAVKKGSGQSCDLVRIMTAAMVIYASYQTGLAAFGPMTGAFDKIVTYLVFDDTLVKLFNDRAVFQSQFQIIEGGYNTITDSMNKIGAQLDALQPPQEQPLPSLAMQKEHFDKVADQFAKFAEAAGYREAGYAFLKAVEARNQAIVDYNAALLRLVQLQAALFSNRQAIDVLRTKLTAGFDPALPLVFTLLTRIYRDTLSFAAVYVHAERKALAYALNEPALAPLSELNAATLIDAHTTTLASWVLAKDTFKTRKTREFVLDLYDFADGKPGGPLTAPSDGQPPDAWAQFKATGRLVFFLRRNHEKYAHKFAHLPGLRLMSAELRLQGVTVKPDATFQDGELFWRLRQGGQEEVYRPNGSVAHFRHAPVSVKGSLLVTGGDGLIAPDFTEDGRYFGLSPFASWHLMIDEFDQFDFSRLAEAQLKVKGSFIEDDEHEI